MKAPNIEIHTVDVRGLYRPEAMLIVEEAAAGLPGEVLEVLSDDRYIVADLVRWCGNGYGIILDTSNGSDGDRFRVAVPTRQQGSHQMSPARSVAA